MVMMYLVMLCSKVVICVLLLEYFRLCIYGGGCAGVEVGCVYPKMGLKHLRVSMMRKFGKYGDFSSMVCCVTCELVVVMNVYNSWCMLWFSVVKCLLLIWNCFIKRFGSYVIG